MNFIDALRNKDTFTENGMPTHSTTLNSCVDLFFQIGALRGSEKRRKLSLFSKAFDSNPLIAMKILFWVRDVRGGAGERQTYRDIVEYLALYNSSALQKNIHLMPEYGRWDDVLTLIGTDLEKDALELIVNALENGNGLCAKWLPRGNGKNQVKKKQAKAIREYLKKTPKEYRKLLASLSSTVENLMCNKEFSKIEYGKVPSKAMSGYMRAFTKNDGDRFSEYLESVSNGTEKINTGAIYPYDVTTNLKLLDTILDNYMLSEEEKYKQVRDISNGAIQQWNNLPDFMGGNKEMVLPLVDVSGSMDCPVGRSGNVTCMDVAISLGLYISERNVGPFKDSFITFSAEPELQHLKGTLVDRFNQLANSAWGYNTNIESVFELILDKSVKNNVAKEDMPTIILILSDMEFDVATNNNGWDMTAQEMITSLYSEHGYEIPKIVYWNLNSRQDNCPVKFDEVGTSLVSGFSPSIFKSILGGKEMTPMSIMLETINQDRYSAIKV
jgi:hypothetical protein